MVDVKVGDRLRNWWRRLRGYRCSECSRRCRSRRGLTLHRKTHAAQADDGLFEGGES